MSAEPDRFLRSETGIRYHRMMLRSQQWVSRCREIRAGLLVRGLLHEAPPAEVRCRQCERDYEKQHEEVGTCEA